MRIGILIKKFNELDNWELRIINKIREDPTLELSLLIMDGRTNFNNVKNKLIRLLKSDNIFGKVLFFIQIFIEKTFFFRPKLTVNKEETIRYLQTIRNIKLSPIRKGYVNFFNSQDSKIIKDFNLDIILRHEFNIIKGEILKSATYGIWSFHHGDNSINRGGPAGFWEIIFNHPVIGATLQKLTTELDGGLIIDKAYYNCYKFFIKNNNYILENSVVILFKNIKKLQNNKLQLKQSQIYFHRIFKTPSFRITLKYILTFYFLIYKRIYTIVIHYLFSIRCNCWALYIGNGEFYYSILHKIQPNNLPKQVFWADPFLFKYNEETYVFFENYSYKTKKGIISCGKIVDDEIVEVKNILEKEYYLSFPFIFEEENEIFLMPETSQNKRLEIYICIQFPFKWKLYSTAFEGQNIADTIYYRDDNNQRWLFLNKGFTIDNTSNLYIYRIDSLRLNKIESHKQNPVIIDSKIARNAGPIYKLNEKIIRPSQCNIYGKYGYGLNLNNIKALSIDDYKEEKIITIEPKFNNNLNSIHHLHQFGDKFVFDAAFKKR